MMLEACATSPAAEHVSACGPKALLLEACATGSVRAAGSHLQLTSDHLAIMPTSEMRTRKMLWLRHASADQARQLQAAVPSMDLEKASKSWWPRPSPGRTATSWITVDRLSRRNRITQCTDTLNRTQ